MTDSSLSAAEKVEPKSAGVRLSVMMFLQYAVWGVWLTILGRYLTSPVTDGGLGFTPGQMGWILGLAGSIGAVASPFIAGQLADRIMNAERALGLLLLIGGGVQWALAYQTSYSAWVVMSITYSVLYMPTLALTNSMAMANLSDSEKKFPFVRAFGTIGWMAASIAFPLIYMKYDIRVVSYWPFLDGTPRADEIAQIRVAMIISGIMSLGYGVYSLLLLPATPPKPDARRPLAFAEAFNLLTRPGFIPVLVAALMIAMIHQVYFFRTGNYITEHLKMPAGDVQPSMAIGQISEIAVLAVFGLFLKRIGYKWVLVLGALSYAARYALFGIAESPLTMKVAMLLHGFNYGFFFAGSFLLVNRISPPDIRHSTQTAYGIIILGLGPVLAGLYNELLSSLFTQRIGELAVTDYRGLWFTQAGVAAAAMIVLIVAFRERNARPADEA